MDLAESHDAQKYGYIFLYMFIHTRNNIEEDPECIDLDGDHYGKISMMLEINHILSSGDT